mmetsp:Transcript_102546/g.306360  ORF Transcript_102546/g.306360 Transcript_102546/m.306360 type:complete len:282 (+) Transcript_102546:84-929(+)
MGLACVCSWHPQPHGSTAVDSSRAAASFPSSLCGSSPSAAGSGSSAGGSGTASRPSSTFWPLALDASPGLYRPPRSSAFLVGFPLRTCTRTSFCWFCAGLGLDSWSSLCQTSAPVIFATMLPKAKSRVDTSLRCSGSSSFSKLLASASAFSAFPLICSASAAASRHPRMESSSWPRWSSRSSCVTLSTPMSSPNARKPATTSLLRCTTSATALRGTSLPDCLPWPPPWRRLAACAFFALVISRFASRSSFMALYSLEKVRSSFNVPRGGAAPAAPAPKFIS